MMKTFCVYNHPLYGQKIEETGTSFTFLGLFFTVIWLAIKKLYLIAALTTALFLISIVADKIVNDLMLSEINTVLSTPLSELYENDRYREIYLAVVDPEIAPWEINKARSTPEHINPFIDPFADTSIQEEKTEASSLQGAIDAIPELAALQAEGGERWQEAIEIDNELRMMPKYRNADYTTRFRAVAKEMGLKSSDNQATFTYALEQIKDLEVISYLIWSPAIALQILIGFNGRKWVIKSLTRRGYELTDTLQAHTKDAVLAQLAKKAAPATAST